MGSIVETALHDVRYGIKLLAKTPGFTLTSVLALALGIGATSAIFSVLNAVILHPLPFRDADRLVTIWESDPRRGSAEVEVSYGAYQEWRKQNQVFDDIAVVSSVNLDMSLTGGVEPQQVESTIVSHTFFPTLGVKAALGRVFSPEDDRPGASNVIISHRLWRSRFGAEPGIIGNSMRIDAESATIIGVMPSQFDYPRGVDVWVPLLAGFPGAEKQQRTLRVFRAVARLRSGVSIDKARADMGIIAQRIDQAAPAGQQGYGVSITPMIDAVFGNARPALWILMASVALVLVIACLNVGNLLLARGAVREREMAIRAAIGAGRRRLITQLLIESLILAAMGTALAFALLRIALQAVVTFAPADIPRIEDVSVDATVLAFTVVLAFVTALLFGVVPAWTASHPDLARSLKETTLSASASVRRARLRNLLVVGEVALSVMLAAGAGLLVRSFRELQALDPGFNPERILTFRVTLASKWQQQQETRRQFYTALLDELKSLPGVESAAAVLLRPLSGSVGWDNPFTIEGQTPELQASNPNANYEAISPAYFHTMQIPLLAGRDFHSGDVDKAQGVVIVSESLARKHWGVPQAIGKRLKLGKPGGPQPWLTVVGVVKDVRYREWQAVRSDLYIPYTQRAQHRSDFVVKTSVDPQSLIAAVRAAVASIDKDQAISNVSTMDALVDSVLAPARFNMLLLSVFALCALVLASIGVYGLIAYFVAQRRTEIGIRMALGASVGRVMRMVIAEGLVVVCAGVAAGVAGALILTRTLGTILYGVRSTDVLTYTGVVVVLTACGLIACIVPAVRAARVDPAAALR